MLKKWRTLDSKLVFDTGWFKVLQETCETHSGRVIDDYFVIQSDDVAIIFALTPDNQVVLVRQYKQGVRDIITEIPAGGINAGEDPEVGARRELREETGYSAAEFVLVSTHLRSPTNRATKDYIFFARDVYLAGPPQFDDNENVETQLVSLETLRQMIKTGEISDIGCLSAIYRVLDYLELLGPVASSQPNASNSPRPAD
jgi:ADP-ribose pyrophosphatase